MNISAQNSDIKSLLLTKPLPLFDVNRKLVLFFSAKSGCTFAVKWFFYQADLLEEAEAFHPFIHQFRQKVFYKSEDYKANISAILSPDMNVIKVVRNPYSRVVSSYIHAIKHGYLDFVMEDFLSRKIYRDNTFTFREFINYLDKTDLWKCNIHHKMQLSSIERAGLIKLDYIIKLENSSEGMKKIERDLNLHSSDALSLSSSSHHTSRESIDGFFGDIRFSVNPKNRAVLPETRSFYDVSLQVKVMQLYAYDFLYYGYDVNELP